VDELRATDESAAARLLSVSRGTHLVVAGDVLGQSNALMVPKTKDGRIIFAIPWLGKVVIGTTDIPATAVEIEPGHQESEIDFLLETVNPYLARPLGRSDILSIFSGLRPLVTGKQATTSKLSREHYIEVSASGLVTVAGGKWTTYRRMAEDTIDAAIRRGLLPAKPCISKQVRLHGAPAQVESSYRLSRYGTDAGAIEALCSAGPLLAQQLDDALPYTLAEVVYAVRHEMARTVEDVLSRRTRALLLDAAAALRAAPLVAKTMAAELGYGPAWIAQEVARFNGLAARFYLGKPVLTVDRKPLRSPRAATERASRPTEAPREA
jgi:glycerol-3-phosphate dehydrogenase